MHIVDSMLRMKMHKGRSKGQTLFSSSRTIAESASSSCQCRAGQWQSNMSRQSWTVLNRRTNRVKIPRRFQSVSCLCSMSFCELMSPTPFNMPAVHALVRTWHGWGLGFRASPEHSITDQFVVLQAVAPGRPIQARMPSRSFAVV